MFNTMSLTGTSAQINNSTLEIIYVRMVLNSIVYFEYSIQKIDKKSKFNELLSIID